MIILTPKKKNKKITVKYGDWSNIPDGKTTQYKNGTVLIQINNNSQDIYATLRSELEHARDFIKGEVPDQNLQHFSRYNGVNEAEVAPAYVYKKSAGKAKAEELNQYKPIDKKELDNYEVKTNKNDAFGENPDINEADYEPYTIYNIKDKEGHNLGHIQITDGNYINWSQSTGKEKGAVRKLIAKLLYEGKYQNLVWDATSESSVKSYERFCREYPDLVDRIQYTDKWSKIDSKPHSNYNSEKGVINEGSQGTNTISERGQVLRTDDISSNSQEIHAVGTNERPNRTDKSGVLDESNPTVNERGEVTNTNNETGLQSSNRQPTQLKLNFNATPNDYKAIISFERCTS